MGRGQTDSKEITENREGVVGGKEQEEVNCLERAETQVISSISEKVLLGLFLDSQSCNNYIIIC